MLSMYKCVKNAQNIITDAYDFSSRAFGVILIYIYVVFMVFSVLDEVGVLPIHLGDNT